MVRSIAHNRHGYSLKTRLYAVIGFLALLPVCGVMVTLVTLHDWARDNAALDRAVRGTIHLERINGLVYAVVMESRGIYMSPDWRAAEQFGKNLMRDLGGLREVARAWKEAIASQRSNVDELSRRIDQFVQFRTELVRLGKEESTAAARAHGDNDANRNVRMALNDSLAVLARAYEAEIGRARAKVDSDQSNFMWLLSVLAVVGVVALCGGLFLVRSALLTPLLRLKDRMMRLAGGDLAHSAERSAGAAEIAEMAETLDVFRADLVDRSRLNRETELLSTLNEWLQSCNSLHELYDMVGAFLAKLLPHCRGSLFIYANSRDVLESAKAWNGGKITQPMHPDDCWGLRRGRTYTYGEHEIDFPCEHVAAADPDAYCCIPILAHGETIGLLHLEFTVDADERQVSKAEDLAEQRRLGVVCAEQISLAIANAKLRDQLRDQSIRDPLTGLFNRRYLLETCRREFARAARNKQGVGVLSIDVDHFKKFNDNHGHDAGDIVLRAVGGCLETMFRSEDVPCRFGGEEFVVILPNCDLAAAARRGEELRAKVEGLTVRYLDQNLPRITISVGVAAFPDAGGAPEAVLKVADQALYRAKEQGRNRVETAGGNRTVTEPDRVVATPTLMQLAGN